MQTPPLSPVALPQRQVWDPTCEPLTTAMATEGGRPRLLVQVQLELQAFRLLNGNQASRCASPDRAGTSVLWGFWAWEEEEVWIWDALPPHWYLSVEEKVEVMGEDWGRRETEGAGRRSPSWE